MAQRRPNASSSLRDYFDKLSRRDLRQVALVAFVLGVVLHACVALTVLGSGGSPDAQPGNRSPAAVPASKVTPTATRPPDRQTCAEIRGTDYRSETERQFFQRNCTAPP